MATQNLSSYNPSSVPNGEGLRIIIIVSEWNKEITFALRDAAISTLRKHGVSPKDIHVIHVPGTFELTYAAKQYGSLGDAVIVLGCVIQGETPHFDYVCQGVTQGITELNLRTGFPPVIFGVLTTENLQQALDRAGGKYGNKGDEAAITALKMTRVSKTTLPPHL